MTELNREPGDEAGIRAYPDDSDERPPLRTGSEGPVDPVDLAMADGEDPTPEAIERHSHGSPGGGSAADVAAP